MRCCASDSGMRSGRTRLVSAGREPEPASTCTRAARDSTVDASNSARTGTWVSRAAPRRDTTCVATSELPPRAKKSSSSPTRSRSRTSANTPATISCVGVVGARNVFVSNSGSGSAFRSSLPEALSGNASSATNTCGTMYDASDVASAALTVSASKCVPATTYATS